MLKAIFFLTFMVFVSAQRSSYLDRFTTQSSYESPYDRHREPAAGSYDRYGSYTSRRPSYQTDKWGDAVGGSGHHHGHDSYGQTTRSYSSSWSSDRDRDTYSSSGRGSSSSSTRFDRNNANVRVVIDLIKLTNDKGFTIDGKKCDTFGQCDPLIYAYIDTDRPNADFPGTIDPKHWPIIARINDDNSPDITKANLTREVCGTPYRGATLRVFIEDADTGTNDIINKFDCDIARDPDSMEQLATWHTGSCQSRATNADAKKMRLSFRYKVHTIPSYRCDATIGQIKVAGGTTAKPKRH